MLVASGNTVFAEDATDPAAVKSEDGKYQDKEGNPTFKVAADGAVDWYTYSGYRRYHSECHVCHGPDGMGSTYAPALKDSLKTMSYADFLGVVASGRKNVSTSQEHLSAGPRQRRGGARASWEARRQARSLHPGGNFLHGQVTILNARGVVTDRPLKSENGDYNEDARRSRFPGKEAA